MQTELFDWLILCLQRAWLYAEYTFHTFMVMWYESEIKYLDKRIARLERELADLQRPAELTRSS